MSWSKRRFRRQYPALIEREMLKIRDLIRKFGVEAFMTAREEFMKDGWEDFEVGVKLDDK